MENTFIVASSTLYLVYNQHFFTDRICAYRWVMFSNFTNVSYDFVYPVVGMKEMQDWGIWGADVGGT